MVKSKQPSHASFGSHRNQLLLPLTPRRKPHLPSRPRSPPMTIRLLTTWQRANNPFGGGGGDASDPFGGGGGDASDPFGGAGGDSSDPFGGDAGGGSDPFGGADDAGSDPFGGAMDDDPFGN